MARETIKMEGLKELDKLLGQLPVNVEKRVLQKAVIKALRPVAKILKNAAPKHAGERSPSSKEFKTLKTNIRVKKFRRTKKGQKGAQITTNNAFWGFFAEMGTRHQPAKPWFLPAFRGQQQRIIKDLGDEIGKGIEEEAKKLRKR